MKANIKELLDLCRWKPYPSKTYEEQQAFLLPAEEIKKMSQEDRGKIDRLRADYVGRLISHRTENAGNYELLLRLKERGEYGGEPVPAEITGIIEAHCEKERNVDSFTRNLAFRTMRYTK